MAERQDHYGHGNGHDYSHRHGKHGHTHGTIDPPITTSGRGIWAIKWSFIGLAVTALLQIVSSCFRTASVCSLMRFITSAMLPRLFRYGARLCSRVGNRTRSSLMAMAASKIWPAWQSS